MCGDNMATNYIRLNNNDEHLSLGNLFRIIKELSKNRSAALQSELFCLLFDIEDINDTTVNNYCIGIRSIGNTYKQIYINKDKRYRNDNNEFIKTILSLLSVMDGNIYQDKDINFINSNDSAESLAIKLFNLAKNDKQVNLEFTNKLNELIKNNNIYDALVEELIYIVLYKKQPINEEGLKKDVLDYVISDTSISSKDLEAYLNLKLREGINYDSSMKILASQGNAYANYELGLEEFNGYHEGYPRYENAYEYLIKAADRNHSGANYLIGHMLINGLIGSKSNKDLKLGYDHLVKSSELGNIASINTIGNMYRDGIYPLKKDLKKAKQYYEEASKYNYTYAINNLGSLEEANGNMEKALDYYLVGASKGESWSCNKVGEYYRKKDDLTNAYQYYLKAIECPIKQRNYFAYYNLAKYYYNDGNIPMLIRKDELKAYEYFSLASKNGIIEASIELLKMFVKKYYKERKEEYLDKINNYKIIIENHPDYNENIKRKVEEELNKIKKERLIDINL